MHTRLFIGGLALLMAALLPAVLSPGAIHADPADLIANGGFEAGSPFDSWTIVDQPDSEGTWCPQSGTSAPGFPCGSGGGSGANVQPPPEGSTAAMTDQDEPSSSVLYQCVTLPDSLVSAELSFQLYLLNLAGEGNGKGKGGGDYASPPSLDYNYDGPNQQFRADLVSNVGIGADPFTVSGDDILLNVYQTQPGDAFESGYDLVSADLSAFAGQTVCVRFALTDNVFFFNAGVDDVRLEIQMPAPTDTPLTPQPTSTLTSEVAAITLPKTGAGVQGSGGATGWLIAALASIGLTALGYGALRLRPNGRP